MRSSVFDVLSDERPTLLKKISENNDLSNVLLAWLGRIIIMSQQRGRPIEGIQMSPIVAEKNTFKSRITFSPLAIPSMSFLQNRGDFYSFTQSKAEGMARALSKNARLEGFFQKVVESLEAYSVRNRIPFSDMRIEGVITPDDVLYIRVKRDILDA